jgi:hypothetical protein
LKGKKGKGGGISRQSRVESAGGLEGGTNFNLMWRRRRRRRRKEPAIFQFHKQTFKMKFTKRDLIKFQWPYVSQLQ